MSCKRTSNVCVEVLPDVPTFVPRVPSGLGLKLCWPKVAKRKVERFLDLLKPVQDDLGHLNDVSRARDLLGALAKRSPQKAAADAVVARLEARVTAADKRARKHVTNLRNAKPFW